MSSIRFDNSVLEPVPSAEPGRQPLRRRVSAPELADLTSIYENEPEAYEDGNMIRIQLPSQSIQVRIIKAFTPFTMAQAMVVRIFEPTLNLEGDYVLKVYDRRYTTELRWDDGMDDWTTDKDIQLERRRWSKPFVKFFLHLMANKWQFYDGHDFWIDDDNSKGNEHDSEPASEDEQQAKFDTYDEIRVQSYCLKMYRAELEVYRRAREHNIDGIDVPRFVSSVRIPASYSSKICQVQSSSIKGVPGILMQYVTGFPMVDLYDTPSPPAPREAWKSIVDDGVRIVQYFMQKMEVRNMDESIARNSVVHWNPVEGNWKCKLIDFGHCEFRQKGTRKWKWRCDQASTDEEGMVGRVMQTRLKKAKGFEYTYERSQYSEELARDFNSLFDTGIEPSEPRGYES